MLMYCVSYSFVIKMSQNPTIKRSFKCKKKPIFSHFFVLKNCYKLMVLIMTLEMKNN